MWFGLMGDKQVCREIRQQANTGIQASHDGGLGQGGSNEVGQSEQILELLEN